MNGLGEAGERERDGRGAKTGRRVVTGEQGGTGVSWTVWGGGGLGSMSEAVELPLESRLTQSASPSPTFLTRSFNGGGPQSVSGSGLGDRGLFWLVLTSLGEKTDSLNVPIPDTSIEP